MNGAETLNVDTIAISGVNMVLFIYFRAERFKRLITGKSRAELRIVNVNVCIIG